MENERIREETTCPQGLTYHEVIEWGMQKALKRDVLITHGGNHIFRITPELREVLRDREDIYRLADIVFKGFRNFTDEFPEEDEPWIIVHTGSKNSEVLSLDIQKLIGMMDQLNMTGRVYTDIKKESGFKIPSGLESNTEGNGSDAEFIASVVSAGFEVIDI